VLAHFPEPYSVVFSFSSEKRPAELIIIIFRYFECYREISYLVREILPFIWNLFFTFRVITCLRQFVWRSFKKEERRRKKSKRRRKKKLGKAVKINKIRRNKVTFQVHFKYNFVLS